MGIIFTTHRILGEMVLPLLIVLAAIYLTVTWKPNAPASPVARLFPALVGIQVLLGLLYWVVGIVQGRTTFLAFPFILHPILGLITGAFAGMAQRRGLFRNLGRWEPLATLGVLLLLVLANVALAMTAA
jgi:phosphate/sulfate permease